MTSLPRELSHAEQIRYATQYCARGQFDDARVLYEAALEHVPDRLDVILRLAQLSLLANDLAAARRHAETALRLAPDFPLPYGLLAEASYRDGDYDRAADCYRKLGRVGLADKARQLAQTGAYACTSGAADNSCTPFLGSGPLPVITARVQGRAVNLVVDSAAGELLLDHAFAAACGLVSGGTERMAFAGGRKAIVQHTIVDELTLGNFTLVQVPSLSLDITDVFAPFFDFPIHGVLGVEILKRFTVTLDFSVGQMILDVPGSSTVPLPGQTQRLWLAGSHYPVTAAQIGEGRPVMLLVDTGMSGADCLVAESMSERVPVLADPDGAVTGSGGGGEVTGRVVRLPELCVAGHCRRAVRAVVLEHFPLERQLGFRMAGMLASDYFRNTILSFDFKRMLLGLGVGDGHVPPDRRPLGVQARKGG